MSRARVRGLAGALLAAIALTVAVWLPVRTNAFVTYDDPKYVTENAAVQGGLSAAGLAWTLTDTSSGNWHPVSWLSHMLDCELFGLRPGPHHLVSLALHTANVALLLLLLAVMTGDVLRSFFVAAAFAVHPLHVESVAWIAERKDLLSVFFALLAIGAWLGWLRRPSWRRYLLVLALYALSLASKPMLVTLPFVLLLLDVWPLRRLDPPRWLSPDTGAAVAPPPVRVALPPRAPSALIVEKLPLVALALLFGVVALATQHRGGTIATLDSVGIGSRLENALVSYVLYLRDAAVPTDLGVLYPYPPHGYSVPLLLGCALVLSLAGIVAVRAARTSPWLTVGWLWYLVTLIPVIGLVQIGVQARADRYTYLPLIGPFLALVWMVPRPRGARGRRLVPVAAAAGLLLLLAWGIATRVQIGYWKDSVSLYARALSIDARNPEIHYNLADSYAERGDLDRAIEHYRAALRDEPDYAEAHNNLGNALRRAGRWDEAATAYTAALALEPASALYRNNLGLLRADQGRLTEAVAHYVEALRLDPSSTAARTNLARAFHGLGRLDDAKSEFLTVLRAAPESADAAYGLANVLADMGQMREAVTAYERSLARRPRHAPTHMRLAVVLALLGRAEEARAHSCIALELDPSTVRLVGGAPRDLAGDRSSEQEALDALRMPCGAPGREALRRGIQPAPPLSAADWGQARAPSSAPR